MIRGCFFFSPYASFDVLLGFCPIVSVLIRVCDTIQTQRIIQPLLPLLPLNLQAHRGYGLERLRAYSCLLSRIRAAVLSRQLYKYRSGCLTRPHVKEAHFLIMYRWCSCSLQRWPFRSNFCQQSPIRVGHPCLLLSKSHVTHELRRKSAGQLSQMTCSRGSHVFGEEESAHAEPGADGSGHTNNEGNCFPNAEESIPNDMRANF